MKITESRIRDVLNWLDDSASDPTKTYQEMTLVRDAAALIRHLQTAPSHNGVIGEVVGFGDVLENECAKLVSACIIRTDREQLRNAPQMLFRKVRVTLEPAS